MAKKTITDLSTEEIMAEIKRREKLTQRLLAKRKKLVKQLADLDQEIEQAGVDLPKSGGKATGGRTRPRNKMTLPEAMTKVMSKDKPMAVADIAAKVREAGYQTTSRTFHTIIFQTLAREGKKFKKVDRGQYVLR